MGTARRLLLAVAVVTPAALGCAVAQTMMPWPGDPPQGAPPPWPGTAQTPGMMSPAPRSPMGGPGMGGPGMGGPGMGGPGMGGGGMPPCMAEFTKLREDVEKKGKAAKAASERKVGREEMCKYITTYFEAEAKWVKYTETNVQVCGIPVQIANQLKQVHSNTGETKQKICSAAQAAGPSLSDALDTTRLGPDNAKTGNGTFDTLTGPAIR
jgi:hypothetical protein